MKTDLLFDFTVDKTAKTVFVNREFAAGLSLVWDAFTKQEILDQWWAPTPYLSKTKFMNFEVGRRRFYAMVSPEGEEHWSLQKYTSISPKTNFKMLNFFADKDENPELPGSDWDLNFSEQNGITKAGITIYNESFSRMKKLLEGFQQGFTTILDNLENLLATLSQRARVNLKDGKHSRYLLLSGPHPETFVQVLMTSPNTICRILSLWFDFRQLQASRRSQDRYYWRIKRENNFLIYQQLL